MSHEIRRYLAYALGKKVLVVIGTLPDSELPDSVTLQLTDDWQTYEIDLASFPRTDLSILMIPLGFTFERQAQSFSLRNARYLRSAEAVQ